MDTPVLLHGPITVVVRTLYASSADLFLTCILLEAWSESADRTLSAENKPRPHHAADGLVHNRLTGNVSPDGAEMLRWRSTDRVES